MENVQVRQGADVEQGDPAAGSMKPSGRIAWIDQLRGWGMLLVMLGHAPFAEFPHRLIYSFHVPLFFALSGWLHTPHRYPAFGGLLKSRWTSLIKPYFAYSAIGYLGLACLWAMGSHPWHLRPWEPLLGSVMGWRNSSPYNGTLWFVSCLLVTEFAFHFLHRWTRGRIGITLLASLAILASFLWGLYGLAWRAPWSADLAMIAIFFFALGRFLRESEERAWLRRLSRRWWVLVCLVWFVTVVYSGRIDMYSLRFQTPLLFVVGASLGVLCSFLLAPRLPQWAWLAYVGRHSLVLLALHEWFAYGIVRILFHRFAPGWTGDEGGWSAAALGFSYLAGGLAIMVPVCLAMDRWLPSLVGGGRK